MVLGSRALGIDKAITRAMRYAISATRLLDWLGDLSGCPEVTSVWAGWPRRRCTRLWSARDVTLEADADKYSVLDSCYQVDIFGPAMFYKAVGLVTSWAICIPRRLCNWDAEEAVSKVGADAAKDILASALLRMVPLRPRRVHIWVSGWIHSCLCISKCPTG